MSDVFDWDRFGDDGRIRFTEPGDEAIGTITALAIRSVPNPSTGVVADMPELTLLGDDGKVRTLLAGQMGLQRLLSENKPYKGDRVKIVFTGVTPLGGGKSAKNFTMAVMRGAAPTALAAPTSAPVEVPTASTTEEEIF